MGLLVLLRHGQSTWNALNLFTGWHDAPLNEIGVAEAKAAGATMRQEGLRFDIGFTSLLARAIATSQFALRELGQDDLSVHRDWRLNERHYGALQGLDKKVITAKYGAAQVALWRRSFDVPPPLVDISNPEHPANDPLYKELLDGGLNPNLLPAGECLKDVVARVIPYFTSDMLPQLRNNKNVIVTAHGNSLRALLMHLEGVSETEITTTNIPTGVPRLYTFGPDNKIADNKVVVRYLGDPTAIAAGINEVIQQSVL